MKFLILILMLINLLTFASFSQIQDPFLKKNQNDIHKKQVTVGILVVDIKKIDDAEQSITLDFAIRLMWKEENLAGRHEKMQLYSYHETWTPDIQIANELDLKRKRNENLEKIARKMDSWSKYIFPVFYVFILLIANFV